MASFDVGMVTERARRTLDGFTRGQKTMLVLAGLGVAAGALGLSRWSGQQKYSTLYSNLAPADAAAVTQSLDSQGIRYQLGSGGASIMVAKDAVYQTRIDMSAKGLPTDGSPGYALLDKQGLTTSEFRQRVDYQRALEGELSKTIRAIHGIDATSVHLVIPQEDLFSGDATKPSASVLIKTASGQRLSGGQVQAIVHLVASSVEGLVPDDVTVADANGNVLAAPGQQDGAGGASARVEQTSAYENTLAMSLQQMVQKVTGDGHAVVRVKAELEFDRKSTTTETFADPKTRSALSEKTSKETYSGGSGSTTATGVLGPNGAPAVPSATGAAASSVPSNASTYLKEDAQSDFALGKVTEKIDGTPGTVTRLSIAVLLDKSKQLKAADAASLRKLVSAAAGLQPARGDSLELGQLAFDVSGAKAAATQLATVSAAEAKKGTFDLVKSVLLALLAIVSLVLAYRGALKSSARIVTPIPLDSLPRSSVMALPSSETAYRLSDLVDDDADDPEDRMAMSASRAALPPTTTARPDIAAVIERQPDDVANTLREWLADRRA